MAKLDIGEISKELQQRNVPQSEIDKVESVLSKLTSETLDKAVIFLGSVTMVLAFGAIVLVAFDKAVTDALWGALGAGIGGLAGIFTGAR